VIVPAPYSVALTDALEAELRGRYGDDDATHADPAQFLPPYGLFLVARVDGVDVGCGGWRTLEPGTGEVKRMYVAPEHRGRGLARELLRGLVADATAQGLTRLVLETGPLQPEAIALYTAEGFLPCEAYGEWEPGSSLFFALELS
jgi:GNAT superfamily N-acetyltransferase